VTVHADDTHTHIYIYMFRYVTCLKKNTTRDCRTKCTFNVSYVLQLQFYSGGDRGQRLEFFPVFCAGIQCTEVIFMRKCGDIIVVYIRILSCLRN
jgi:hypothetical protein